LDDQSEQFFECIQETQVTIEQFFDFEEESESGEDFDFGPMAVIVLLTLHNS
jgi:hypothetical protein